MESLKAMTDLTALLRNSFQVLGFRIELNKTVNVILKICLIHCAQIIVKNILK